MPQLISWRAVLDIILIALALFFLYRTLIRLGTWKIVAGILIAAVIFFIANYLNLEGIEWIYRNVSHVAVLSLVVLFQPELRKLFEKAASMRRSRSIPHDEKISGIIAEGVWLMASKRTGAIIVIPGREPVNEWLNGGFPVNAIPSVPFIQSIFDPNSPGHDGALVVKQGRFSSFGVRLPVSLSGRLSEEYGTRHQAAMGLSERSDALIIVVSEERGKISVFHNAKFKTISSENHLFTTICSHCGTPGGIELDTPAKSMGWRVPVEIVGSLSVAIIFWISMIAAEREMLEKIITVPVEYTATAEEIVMIGEKPTEIRLHLAGSKADLDAVTPSALSAKIDLSKSVEGKQVFLISDTNIQLPKGIRLIDVNPSNVEITMAKLIKKELEIKPQLIGQLPEGIEMDSIRTLPEKALAFLPSLENGQKKISLTTTPVYLNSIRESTTLFCKVVAPPSIQPIEKRWPDISVIITIKPISPVKPKGKP